MVVGEISTGTDVLVIGAGPAGYLAAIRAAQRDRDVVLVDRNESLGGVCLNEGCIPSKALIHAATVFDEAAAGDDLGLSADPSMDHDTLQDWKAELVNTLTSGVKLLEEKYGVTVVTGDVYLASSEKAHIAGSGDAESVAFDDCIVATGSSPITIPGLEPDGETILTSSAALDMTAAPDDLLIVGGGYIGMELGMVYQTFGSSVTVLEASDRILQGYQADLVEPVEQRADEMGIDIVTNAQAQDAETVDGRATLTVETAQGTEEYDADTVLVAVGRTPNTDDVGLENTDATIDENGFVETDTQMRTADDSIYAIGDVAGQPMLAHKGYQEGAVAAEAITGEPAAADFVVPAVIYTDPEIATVGMTVEEAEEQGFDPMKGTFRFAASGRAATMDRDDGFIRVIADRESHALLGAQMVGPRVSELIGEATLAIEMGARLDDIVMTVHAHPTLSEAFKEACEDALGQAIHKYNPQE
jgi:dihydrolipoamide dehydrogenase